MQALIPYGAQTLMATSLAGISPVEPLRYLFYPQVLVVCLAISILVIRKRSIKDTTFKVVSFIDGTGGYLGCRI